MATHVTDATFEADVLQSDIPVLVDFYAPWCGPCKIMAPVVDELANEQAGKVKVVKMNVDENPHVPSMLQIMSIPTFIGFKNGKPVKGFMGALPKEDVVKFIKDYLVD